MSNVDQVIAAGRRQADRYRALNRRTGTNWRAGDHQLAISMLLGAAAHYRAAAELASQVGDSRAADLAWSAQRVTELVEDHQIWAELDRTAATGEVS